MVEVGASSRTSAAGAQHRLSVALLSLPPRTRAVLEFFFMSTGRSAFQTVAEGVAEALIFDADHPDSRRHWEDVRAQRDVPAIVLSIAEQTLPGTIWVQKPVTATALLAAAAKLAESLSARPASARAPAPLATPAARTPPRRQEADSPGAAALLRSALTPTRPAAPPAAPAAGGETPAPTGDAAPSAVPTAPAAPQSAAAPAAETAPPPPMGHGKSLDPELEAQLCGTRDDVPAARIHREVDLFFHPDTLLVGALREVVASGRKWRVPVAVDTGGCTLAYSPAHNRMYATCGEDDLHALCRKPLPPAAKVRALGLQEFAAIRSAPAPLTVVERADAFIWRVGLEASAGRLPAGTSLQQELFLKHWPNLTRMLLTPHAFRIAALWGTRGASLMETARLLGIPQRHVFAFYNAAQTLDLITHDGGHIRQRKPAEEQHQERGLLSRLFGWLRGKR